MSEKQANFEKKWAISDAKIHWLSIYAHIFKSSVRISDSVRWMLSHSYFLSLNSLESSPYARTRARSIVHLLFDDKITFDKMLF